MMLQNKERKKVKKYKKCIILNVLPLKVNIFKKLF